MDDVALMENLARNCARRDFLLHPIHVLCAQVYLIFIGFAYHAPSSIFLRPLA